MEAVWTRFFPAIKPLLASLSSPGPTNVLDLGKPIRLFVDFSLCVGSREHRLYDASLGGGSLLDLGIYCITWAMLVLFNDPRNKKKLPNIAASMLKSNVGSSGQVDETTTIALTFENTGASAILSSSLVVKTFGDGIVIQCEKVGFCRLYTASELKKSRGRLPYPTFRVGRRASSFMYMGNSHVSTNIRFQRVMDCTGRQMPALELSETESWRQKNALWPRR